MPCHAASVLAQKTVSLVCVSSQKFAPNNIVSNIYICII